MQTQYQKLTDPQWEVMKEFLPIQRKRKYGLRAIVDSIFLYLRIGSQWRNLPEGFPKWQLVYYYFRKWQKDGSLERLNWGMNQLYPFGETACYVSGSSVILTGFQKEGNNSLSWLIGWSGNLCNTSCRYS